VKFRKIVILTRREEVLSGTVCCVTWALIITRKPDAGEASVVQWTIQEWNVQYEIVFSGICASL
jgi:hypothetical protein